MKAWLENVYRLQALRALEGVNVVSRVAQITSYDPSRFAVKVEFQPDGVYSGWLPLATPWAGNGWGMFAAPAVGAMVEVTFIEGALDSGIAALSLYPLGQTLDVPAGEFWLVHSTGAFLKLTTAGALELADAGGATLTMNGSGAITIEAPGGVNINGATISAAGEITNKAGVVLGTHTHSGVETGSGTSGPPVA